MELVIEPINRRLGDVVNIYKMAEKIWLEWYRPYYSEHAIRTGLQRYCSPEVMAAEMKDGTNYYVLRNKDEPAGFLALKAENGLAHISKLYLLKEYRGTGLGGAALRFAEKYARENTCGAIELQCALPNVVARSVYEHHGYRIVRRFMEDLDGESSEEAILRKTLT